MSGAVSDPAHPEREGGGLPEPVLGVQPDRRSCGACCLVVARALRDPDYAARLAERGRWAREVLRTHREVTALRDRGRLGVPWPRALGTPPWAVARRLRALSGRSWRVRAVRLRGQEGWRADAAAAATDGRPTPLFVGTPRLPRHVTLVVGTEGRGLRVYDPARGSVFVLPHRGGLVGATGWSTPWFVVELSGR